MARAQAQRRRQARAQARQKAKRPEDLMFFSRLRRRAKWIFGFLAFAFALSFVALGVGTGVSGTSLGDVLRDFLGSQSASGESVDDAAKKVAERPGDPQAQLDYANALQRAGRTQEAIAALETYTQLRPRDTDALRQLAVLYGTAAARARQEQQTAEAEAQEASLPQLFADQGALAQAVTENKIAETIAAAATARAQAAQARAQGAAQGEARIWEQLTLLQPDDPSVFLQLGAASQSAQDYDSAIAAYEQFLELAPDDSSAALVKEQLELLKQVQGATSGGGS